MHYTLTHPDLEGSEEKPALLVDLSPNGDVNRLCFIADPERVTESDYEELAKRGNDSPLSVVGITRENFDTLFATGISRVAIDA